MPSLAERIYEETKTLPEPQAREVLDFIGYLKRKGAAPRTSIVVRRPRRRLGRVREAGRCLVRQL